MNLSTLIKALTMHLAEQGDIDVAIGQDTPDGGFDTFEITHVNLLELGTKPTAFICLNTADEPIDYAELEAEVIG